MTYMISELDGVAFDLPSAAFRRGNLVLVGVVALLKAASKSACFLVRSLCCVLCSGQCGSTRKQRKKRHRGFDFHSLPPKLRFEKWKPRPGTRLVDYAYLGIRRLICTVAVWFPTRHILAAMKAGDSVIMNTVLPPFLPAVVGKDAIPKSCAQTSGLQTFLERVTGNLKAHGRLRR